MAKNYMNIPHILDLDNQLLRNFGSVLVLSTFYLLIYSSLCVGIYMIILLLRY